MTVLRPDLYRVIPLEDPASSRPVLVTPAPARCPCGHSFRDHRHMGTSPETWCVEGCSWRECEASDEPCLGHECDCPDHREERALAEIEEPRDP